MHKTKEEYTETMTQLEMIQSKYTELASENSKLSEVNSKILVALGESNRNATILAVEYISNKQTIDSLTATVNELNNRLEARVIDLDEYEFHVACSIVMGEAGGESDRGILLLAQALADGCTKNGVTPSQLRSLYQYQGYNEKYSERVANAVTAVFKEGRRVIDDTLLYMYNPILVASSWHESRPFVTQEGNIRFFK